MDSYVCDLSSYSIRLVDKTELIQNQNLIPASEWGDFLRAYSDIIDALIEEVDFIFINTFLNPSRAHNDYANCFGETAACLYKKLREKALMAHKMNIFQHQHWYINLKTLTYCWKKETIRIECELIDGKFLPLAMWKSFIAKRKFGRLISENTDNEINIRARELWFNENNINKEEFLNEYI